MPGSKKRYNTNNFALVRQSISMPFKPLPQSGYRISVPRDRARISLSPGKRISRNGKRYWETRKNRSDVIGSSL